MNENGEPNFRVIHGSRAIDVVMQNGKEIEMPRYLPRNNWHLTAWIPAAQNPPRGGYEHCYALGTQLDEGLIGKLVQLIQFSRQYTMNERYQAIMEREAKAERDFDAEAFDILDDGVKAFHGQPFVVKGSKKETHERSIVITDSD